LPKGIGVRSATLCLAIVCLDLVMPVDNTYTHLNTLHSFLHFEYYILGADTR